MEKDLTYLKEQFRICLKNILKNPARAKKHPSTRHTFATRMLELGENARVVQELLGHKNITQTLNTYTHVLEETKRSAMSKINVLMQSFGESTINPE